MPPKKQNNKQRKKRFDQNENKKNFFSFVYQNIWLNVLSDQLGKFLWSKETEPAGRVLRQFIR